MENIVFNQIAGYQEEKKELSGMCYLLKNRDELKAMGGKLPHGVFLLGPNGVGKTVLANAFIRESGCPCVEFNSNDISSDDEFTEYVKGKFKEAADMAPCILFIDEIDKIAGNREMAFVPDNVDRSRVLLNEINHYKNVDGLFFLFAGNRNRALDYSIIRPGRIDRIIEINYPTETERKEIIGYYSKGKTLEPEINTDELARIFNGFTGADIESVLNNAVIRAFTDQRKAVSKKDIMDVYYDRLFHATEKNLKNDDKGLDLLSYHEAGHAAASLLYNRDKISYATIISRAGAGGFVQTHYEEKSGTPLSELISTIDVILAGYVAEDMFLGFHSAGCSSDIQKARRNAEALICDLGYKGIGLTSGKDDDGPFSSPGLSTPEKRKAQCDEIEKILFEREKRATELLSHNRSLVKLIADGLKERHVLYKEDLQAIYEDYKKGKENEKEYELIVKSLAFTDFVSTESLMELFNIGNDEAEHYLLKLEEDGFVKKEEEKHIYLVSK